MDFQKKYEELREKAERIENLEYVYNKVLNDMRWDCCEYHEADEEHEDRWWTEPESEEECNSWQWSRYLAYKEVLEAIEKLAK